MCNENIRLKLIELGLEEIQSDSFYKEVDCAIGFNYCYFSFVNDYFLSIRAGKKDQDYERTILSLLYVKNEVELINIISRSANLLNIFPQIVSIPYFDTVFQYAQKV